MDPKGKMGHWSARTKLQKKKSEEPKEGEKEKQEKVMEVDQAAHREASAEVQSPRLWQSTRKKERKWSSCQVPLVNYEGPFIGATIDAVKRPSDTGSSLNGH